MHHLKGHDNIVTLVGAFEDKANVHLVSPSAPCTFRPIHPSKLGCPRSRCPDLPIPAAFARVSRPPFIRAQELFAVFVPAISLCMCAGDGAVLRG